ncbi:hypothetical protein DRW48_12565 [Paracoccus suum]|uniref:Uncharacterized protein n=1 Tax=Paracoccus suum TaxID=2259340 RepID=A0A344PPG5_9RHOB|nr:hypothetical protein DRW48_12565 [Paracoccus suum]
MASLTATSILAGCATKSEDISASYVSPNMFQQQSCGQLGEEAQRLSARATAAVSAQDRKASNDAAATAVSLVLFWPAAFLIKGDKASAAEVARLKGEMHAIEQASAQKRCNIRFNS